MKLLAVMFCSALALPCAAGEIQIVTSSGTSIVQELAFSGEGDGLSVTVTDASGRRSIPCNEIVEIRFSEVKSAPAASVATVDIERTSGDRFIGTLEAGSESAVALQGSFLGKVALPFEQVRSIRSLTNVAHAPPRPGTVDEDLVFTRSGDRGKGYLISIDATALTYHSSARDAEARVALEDFAAVYLSPTQEAPKTPVTLFAIVLSADGSSLQGTLRTVSEDALTVVDLYGASHEIPLARIASVYFRNGKIVYLSDLTPSAIDENANYIRLETPLPRDLAFPWQADRNARGGPIVLKKTPFRKGIGVHAYSSLTFDLSGSGFQRFQATVGLDDLTQNRGHVVFKVRVDDTIVLEKSLGGSDPSFEVNESVSNAKSLTLIVDFGKGANQLDYADWAGARLIR